MAKKHRPPLYSVGASNEPSRATKLLEEAAQEEALRFIEGFGSLRDRCESPIEELLMAALYAGSNISEVGLHFLAADSLGNAQFDEAAFIYQQVQVGRYRVDIAIIDATLPFEIGEPRLMIVECDGHDYHERTKEQARRDRQQDRFFQSKGFKVLRFTGSEIWADAHKCADEIVNELACNDYWRNRAG